MSDEAARKELKDWWYKPVNGDDEESYDWLMSWGHHHFSKPREVTEKTIALLDEMVKYILDYVPHQYQKRLLIAEAQRFVELNGEPGKVWCDKECGYWEWDDEMSDWVNKYCYKIDRYIKFCSHCGKPRPEEE